MPGAKCFDRTSIEKRMDMPKEGAKAMKTHKTVTIGISQVSTENHRVVTRDEWVAERKALLARERN